jgi:hypothetical protein
MHRIAEKGVVVVDGDGLSPHHPDRLILELPDERVDRSGRHDVVAVDEDQDRSSCCLDEKVDGRRLAGSILLDDETYSRIIASERGDDVRRPVGAATRHDNQLE